MYVQLYEEVYGLQSQQEEVEEEGEGRRPKRRSSNAGVHYSEDLSDAMFDRLLQPDDQPGSASEVTCPPPAVPCHAMLCHAMQDRSKKGQYRALSLQHTICKAMQCCPV